MSFQHIKSLIGAGCALVALAGAGNAGGFDRGGVNIDLLFDERAHLLAIEGDHTNQLVIPQHRHTKYSSEFTEFSRDDGR